MVEGEPFYLKYCSCSPAHEIETITKSWYKSSGSQERVELNPRSSSRIALHGCVLEFWPVELNDTGSYSFQMEWVTLSFKNVFHSPLVLCSATQICSNLKGQIISTSFSFLLFLQHEVRCSLQNKIHLFLSAYFLIFLVTLKKGDYLNRISF